MNDNDAPGRSLYKGAPIIRGDTGHFSFEHGGAGDPVVPSCVLLACERCHNTRPFGCANGHEGWPLWGVLCEQYDDLGNMQK